MLTTEQIDAIRDSFAGVTDIPSRATVQRIAKLALEARAGDAVGWFTDDHETDKSATTYDKAVADRWKERGWPVSPFYLHPPTGDAAGKDSVDAARYRKWVSYSGFTKEHTDAVLDAVSINEHAAIASLTKTADGEKQS